MRMLKHVSHRSSSSLSRPCDHSSFRNDAGVGGGGGNYPSVGEMEVYDNLFRRNDDNVSLVSALSFSSLAVGGKFCSRTSSTISLNDHSIIPVKIYLRRLRSDMEYKTVSLSLQTTCRELILLLLAKFRLRHRDPNLFFVLMEVTVRSPSDGAPVKRQLVLEDNARPAELQQCRPKGEANFSIGVRRGGLVRVHDSILMPGSQYKSLMVSYNTTAEELVRLVVNCYSNKEDAKYYCLHEACKDTGIDRLMKPDEFPIQVQSFWPKENKTAWSFVLQPNVRFSFSSKSMNLWRRSLDQSGTDTESELGDHDITRASIMSSSSTLSSASHSSTSSGVSSNSSSSSSASCCSSSSGVSSTDCDSLISSPVIKRTPSSATLTPESNPSKVHAKPPKPVPRTLFPSLKVPQVNNLSSDEDSGIVLDDDFSPLKVDAAVRSNGSVTPPSVSRITFSPLPKVNSKYARIKSLSKSSMDLKSISASSKTPSEPSSSLSPSLESHSKSTLNLNFKGLFMEKTPWVTSTPKSHQSPRTPNAGMRTFGSESKVLSPLKQLRLSTSLKKEPSCTCKSCFYI